MQQELWKLTKTHPKGPHSFLNTSSALFWRRYKNNDIWWIDLITKARQILGLSHFTIWTLNFLRGCFCLGWSEAEQLRKETNTADLELSHSPTKRRCWATVPHWPLPVSHGINTTDKPACVTTASWNPAAKLVSALQYKPHNSHKAGLVLD